MFKENILEFLNNFVGKVTIRTFGEDIPDISLSPDDPRKGKKPFHNTDWNDLGLFGKFIILNLLLLFCAFLGLVILFIIGLVASFPKIFFVLFVFWLLVGLAAYYIR